MNDPLQKAHAPRLSFLGWCLLLSTIANISSAGLLSYVAFATLNVRVNDGYVDAYIRGGPVAVTGAVTVDGEVTVKTRQYQSLPVSVDGAVSVKTDLYSPLDVRIR